MYAREAGGPEGRGAHDLLDEAGDCLVRRVLPATYPFLVRAQCFECVKRARVAGSWGPAAGDRAAVQVGARAAARFRRPVIRQPLQAHPTLLWCKADGRAPAPSSGRGWNMLAIRRGCYL